MLDGYKSHAISPEHVTDEKCLCRNTSKSILSIVVVGVLCVAVFLLAKQKVFCLPFLFELLFLIFRKEQLLFAGYSTFMTYQQSDDKYCILYFSEIENWEYHENILDSLLTLTLKSDEKIVLNRGINYKVYLYLSELLKDKEKS